MDSKPVTHTEVKTFVDGLTTEAKGKLYWDAADIIEKDGWCIGSSKNSECGGLCAVGGASITAGVTEASTSSLEGAQAVTWNDYYCSNGKEAAYVCRGVSYMLDHGGKMSPWFRAWLTKKGYFYS